jgi:hypothetical protein
MGFGLAAPPTAVSLTPSPVSPAMVGTSVKFTAAASGGTGTYEYKFLLRLPGDTTWNMVRAYSTEPTWTWNTAGLAVGTYQVVVQARGVGSTSSFETSQAISYGLSPQP